MSTLKEEYVKNNDIQVIAIARRNQELDCIMLPSNTGNRTSLEQIKNNIKKLDKIPDSYTVEKFSNFLKENNIYHKGIELAFPKKIDNKWDCLIDYILMIVSSRLVYKREYIKHLQDYADMLCRKYKNATVKIIKLNDYHIPKKLPNDVNGIGKSNLGLLIMTDILEKENELLKYLEIPECFRKIKIHDRLEIVDIPFKYGEYKLTMRNFVKGFYDRLKKEFNTHFITYGCNLGDKKLCGYNHYSLKTKRDNKLGINNMHFFNCDDLSLEMAIVYSAFESYGSHWDKLNRVIYGK